MLFSIHKLIFLCKALILKIIVQICALLYITRRVLVYRLGGTTLDVTVLVVNGGMYRVIATESDTALGGRKFDELLAHHLAAEFQRFLFFLLIENSGLGLQR